tara:strand:+ start:222 stop:344 length:123 start_codon:yes stop_codon:yes gene_type:complete
MSAHNSEVAHHLALEVRGAAGLLAAAAVENKSFEQLRRAP